MRYASKMKLFLMILGIFWAARSLAASDCISEIRKADHFVSIHGGSTASSDAAQTAIGKCSVDFTDAESAYYQSLAKKCQDSFAGMVGTASDAMKSVCQMNAVRYLMSLQLAD